MTQRKINKKNYYFLYVPSRGSRIGQKVQNDFRGQFPVCFVVYKVISYLQNKKRS